MEESREKMNLYQWGHQDFFDDIDKKYKWEEQDSYWSKRVCEQYIYEYGFDSAKDLKENWNKFLNQQYDNLIIKTKLEKLEKTLLVSAMKLKPERLMNENKPQYKEDQVGLPEYIYNF